MKKLIIAGLLISSPLVSFAYDALTPTEDALSLLPNSNFLLREDYKNYCDTNLMRLEKEMSAVSLQDSSYQTRSAMTKLKYEYQQSQLKCVEVKQKIEDQVNITTEQNRRLGCGTDFVKRGGQCLTPTATCQMYFGNNVTGIKSVNKVDTAECTCNSGYSFSSNLCVANNPSMSSASAILSVNTVNTEAQLREVIAQLTAQVMILIKQLNAKMGR